MSIFKTGDRVRLKSSEHGRVGTVGNIADGMAAVSYDHRPGVSTKGYYPIAHLELAEPVQVEVLKAPAVKPKATTAEILGGAK